MLELLLDTSCQARRWAGLISRTITKNRGMPAMTIRLKRTSHRNMNTAMRIRLKISSTKLMMPLERASDTELT